MSYSITEVMDDLFVEYFGAVAADITQEQDKDKDLLGQAMGDMSFEDIGAAEADLIPIEDVDQEPHMKLVHQFVFRNGELVNSGESNIEPTIPTFHCTICNKNFKGAGYYTQHLNHSHSTKIFKCQKCGKKFESEMILKKHMKNHDSESKNFQCTLCPKGYIHRTDFVRHMMMHGGNDCKPYKCEQCPKAFARGDHLEKHKLSHRRKREKIFQKVLKKVIKS